MLIDTFLVVVILFYLPTEVKVSRNAVPVKELLPVRRSGQNF